MTQARKMSLDQAILYLIEKNQVPDQSTLLSLLKTQGFFMTQGTLSRRLGKLSVQKKNGKYERVIPENHPLPPYTLIESPPNIIMLHTGPHYGMALAVRVDRSKLPGIAGTLAGEDTLLVAIKANTTLAEVRKHIEAVLGPPAES